MLKNVNITFLIINVNYFRDFRRENLIVFTNFYQRLNGFFVNKEQNRKSSRNLIHFFQKIISLISVILRQVVRLPSYFIQTRVLSHLKLQHIESCEAFCIASTRLELDGNEGVSLQLDRITEAIGGGDVLNLFSGHGQQRKTIILYDPQLESGFWRRGKTSHDEKIFIFDGAYIIFLSITLLFSGLFFRGAEEVRFLRRYLKQIKVNKDEQAPHLYVRVIEALTFITLNNLNSKFPRHSTAFLTSNSFFAELLRIYILQNKGSGKIVELLHGIIADPTEVWFKRLLDSQNKTEEKQLLLIPQVPNLPELETLKIKYFVESNVSINTYLNASLYENKKLYGSFKAYALNHLKQLNLCPDDQGLILTIYGGTSIEGNFFHSSLFEVEVKVLNKAIEYFLNKKIAIKIIYVPHPSNKILSPMVANIFKKLGVQVLDNSIFTYFVTDYCISNISSCLFELNWFGAQCFTPLIEADGIYSKNYLNTIHYPKANGMKALEDSLYGFFEEGLRGDNKSYIEKFYLRLKMVKGSNFN